MSLVFLLSQRVCANNNFCVTWTCVFNSIASLQYYGSTNYSYKVFALQKLSRCRVSMGNRTRVVDSPFVDPLPAHSDRAVFQEIRNTLNTVTWGFKIICFFVISAVLLVSYVLLGLRTYCSFRYCRLPVEVKWPHRSSCYGSSNFIYSAISDNVGLEH
jgi:hypothetical protein